MPQIRAPFVTYDSTLLDHVSVTAASAAARTSMRAAAVLFFTALTAAVSQLSIHVPFTPVPMTLQPIVVLIGAAVLGPRLAVLSQVLYLALGIVGLPVFAASAVLPQGAARLLGPTGGYLMAYPLAACVTGWLARRGYDRRYLTSIVAMLSGLAMIFLGGVLWLASGIGWSAALATGLYPFVVADLIEVCVAAAILPGLWRLVRSLDESV